MSDWPHYRSSFIGRTVAYGRETASCGFADADTVWMMSAIVSRRRSDQTYDRPFTSSAAQFTPQLGISEKPANLFCNVFRVVLSQ